MERLDLVFNIVITEKMEFSVECEARNINTDKITTYKRVNQEPKKAMESIINYLKREGKEIYNVTFKALNIG